MKFHHEDLEIWQLAMNLIPKAYKLFDRFPPEERFGLCSQGKRAVISVVLNIAEGSGRHSKKDFSNFINRSITSLHEVDTVLKVAVKLKYTTQEDYNFISPDIEKLYFKMIAFNKTLKSE
ncbi:four helix bundle protein [Candidatus Falkowbacteria bacterium]|nr:four helix bundle protein [Candidatus Falkowbacteria bacterium]